MNFQSHINKIRTFLSYKVFTAVIYGLLAAVLFGVLYHNVKPETYDIEQFSVADKTIRSPKTVEDEAKTEEEREIAADNVDKVYVLKKEAVQHRISLIGSIFDYVKETNQEHNKAALEAGEAAGAEESAPPAPNRLKTLKSKLTANVSEDITDSVSDKTLAALLDASQGNLAKTKSTVIRSVESTMAGKIREEQLQRAKESASALIAGLPDDLLAAAKEIGSYAIVPNELYDPSLTEERREQARASVEPVKILQGQIVVQEGHLIDREIYRQLEMLGLLKNNPTIKPLVGLLVFVGISIGALYLHFSRMNVAEERKQNSLLLVSVIFILSLILMKIIGLLEEVGLYGIAFIFPAAMAPMLIKILLNERIALVTAILLAACGSIIFHDGISGTIDVEVAIYILFSGMAGILFLGDRNERNRILRAGVFVSLANIGLMLFLTLMGSGQFTTAEYFYYILYAIGSGIISAILTMGLLPYFEAGFGVLSAIRLIELSNPNHPLLKKILMEAPGTYHHSVMVANLAEAACEAIDANGLLARVGCYYHDIGKTKRPHFFIENQMGHENPHDRLPPQTSRDIIIAHAVDGAEELRKHKLPKEIVDIAEQHHGTSLLKFFYFKAKEKNPDLKEEDYRYPGPKPQTKEAAVISLADSVEAAVRSMNHPTSGQIRLLVHNIVQDKLLDGQFNECDITLKELEIVKRTFCETLNGIFHSRIEYPDFKQQKVVNDGVGN